ncbi:hypothetical protein ACHAXR_001611 [Thalassiosira sp. AJA248-18]
MTWTDVKWDALFNNSTHIGVGPVAAEHYGNGRPGSWKNCSLAFGGEMGTMPPGSAYSSYKAVMRDLFDMSLAQSIVKLLNEKLSPLVLSFLTPIRQQSYTSDLHLCTHIREGNNETGDWAKKLWRHIDLNATLNATLDSMKSLAKKWKNGGARRVTVFVASDTPKSRPWFRDNAPPGWHIVQPGKELPPPENGVWFGEYKSDTNKHLNQTEKDNAMAEAVADVFALGECDALFIPNYSSFSVIGIIQMRAEKRMVFFWNMTGNTYIEFPYPMNSTYSLSR